MKKIFTTKGPAKPVYKHTWNQDDKEEPVGANGGDSSRSTQSQEPSSTSTANRVSPEKRKQESSSQDRVFFKSKVSRTAVTGKTTGSEEKTEEDAAKSQVRCSKSEKGYYTVVRNVKEAKQCREWGEAQEIKADIEYLVGAVLDGENPHVKCLGVINIATKCQSAQFRAHLRAHGSSIKLFAALTEAPKVPSLAICTACVIYLLSRDRLGITIDQRTLELIVELVNLPADDGRANRGRGIDGDEEYENYRQRVWKILNEWRQQTEAAVASGQASQPLSNSQKSSDGNGEPAAPQSMMFDITSENLSARFLAIEALTFICCRTHDDSFRKWMRESRGLHQIAQYLTKEAELMLALDPKSDKYASTAVEHVKMLERYLRILEHASLMNQQNQAYLVVWESSSLVFACARLFKFLKSLVDRMDIGEAETSAGDLPNKSIITVLSASLKTLLNLSHSNVLCCSKLGEYEGFIGDCVDFVITTIPEHIQAAARFDLLVLSLGLLINLVEPCSANRRLITNYVGRTGEKTLLAFTKVFIGHEAAAQASDDEVERVFESSQEANERRGNADPSEADMQETVNAALKKASKHMEDSIVASHVALFLGLVLQQNEGAVEEIKNVMPDGKLDPLVAMLQKFLDFMRLTNAVGRTGEKTISKAMEAFDHLS